MYLNATDITVECLHDVDMSDIRLPIVAVYEHPSDYPDLYIARLYDKDKPTNVIMKDSNLEGIQRRKPNHMVRIVRNVMDDPTIVESWI